MEIILLVIILLVISYKIYKYSNRIDSKIVISELELRSAFSKFHSKNLIWFERTSDSVVDELIGNILAQR